MIIYECDICGKTVKREIDVKPLDLSSRSDVKNIRNHVCNACCKSIDEFCAQLYSFHRWNQSIAIDRYFQVN